MITPLIAAFEEANLTLLERGWLSSNNILFGVGTQTECVLVDSGYSSHSEQTVQLVRFWLTDRRLDRVINTHLHSDHCGGNHALQSAYGCAIDVPAASAARVDDWDAAALHFEYLGQCCERFERDRLIEAGQVLVLGNRSWEVVATPGHDPDSVALYQRELGLLISADALWEDGFGVVFPELEGQSGFADVRKTLDALSALDVRVTIPGHGAAFTDFEAALDRAYRRLDKLESDPRRHGRHAAKVLIKFHLLEVRAMSLSALWAWCEATPIMGELHRRYFSRMPFGQWLRSLVEDLERSGAVRSSDGVVADA